MAQSRGTPNLSVEKRGRIKHAGTDTRETANRRRQRPSAAVERRRHKPNTGWQIRPTFSDGVKIRLVLAREVINDEPHPDPALSFHDKLTTSRLSSEAVSITNPARLFESVLLIKNR